MAKTLQKTEVMSTVAGRRGFNFAPYLFILPHLILFLTFIGYPLFSGLYISLFRYDYLRPDANVFVGLDNYVNLFTPGSVVFQRFWNAMINTLLFVIFSVPLLILIPLLLALLLNSKLPGRNIFRAVYFAPWVLSVAVISLLWWWMFQSQGGLINFYARALGFEAPRWLSTMPWAGIAIIIATVWWTLGFNMIIILAAMQEIPETLYEAARIDGASRVQQFFSITLPLLRSVMVFIVITTIIASFNLFGQPLFMTNGQPSQAGGGGATEPVMLYIFRQGFEFYNQGSAAAMSFVVATFMMIVSVANFFLFRKRDMSY
jgi:multiple sugar transport system permease protein